VRGIFEPKELFNRDEYTQMKNLLLLPPGAIQPVCLSAIHYSSLTILGTLVNRENWFENGLSDGTQHQ